MFRHKLTILGQKYAVCHLKLVLNNWEEVIDLLADIVVGVYRVYYNQRSGHILQWLYVIIR